MTVLAQGNAGFLAWQPAAMVALGVVAVAVIAAATLIRQRRSQQPGLLAELRIDVADLPDEGPPTEGPQLRAYHIRVRLAVVVLAPLGRGSIPPSMHRLPELVDQLVPGMSRLIEPHQTLVRLWRRQLSATGFGLALANLVRLPGDDGRGTPWSALTGRFVGDSQPMMAGLVVRAESPNNISQIEIEEEQKWLDIVRIIDEQTE